MQPALTEPILNPPSLQELIDRCPDLPVLPPSVLRVLRLTDSGDATAKSVGEAISLDPSLAARVLRLANSALFGMARSVKTLPDAVLVLGFRTVRSLATAAGIAPSLARGVPGYCLEADDLLIHAFGVASGAMMLARVTRKAQPDTAFIAGLLADIGKLVIARSLEERQVVLMNLGQSVGMPFDEIERRVVGHDHAEVGAFLSENWGLPEDIVAAIRNHHQPSAIETPPPLTDCVHLGAFLTLSLGIGLGSDGLHYDFDAEALQRLGLAADDLDELVDDFALAVESYESVLKELKGK